MEVQQGSTGQSREPWNLIQFAGLSPTGDFRWGILPLWASGYLLVRWDLQSSHLQPCHLHTSHEDPSRPPERNGTVFLLPLPVRMLCICSLQRASLFKHLSHPEQHLSLPLDSEPIRHSVIGLHQHLKTWQVSSAPGLGAS